MNSGHSHYISLDEPRKTRWLPLAFVAIAASVGVLIGSGISKASAETALYTATSVRGIPIVQAQPSYLTQARNVHVASAVETSDEKFPEQTQFVEENVSTSNASWTSMALIPLAAAAGFFLGSRKVVKKSVSDETFEVVIDDGEEEIAMAATTGGKELVYAVIAIGSRQYLVQPGEILSIDKLPLQVGDEIAFDKVLLLRNGEKIDIGQPYVSNVRVTAEVLRNSKGKKIRIFKYRAKKHYRLTKGHRTKYTDIHITEIDGHKIPSKVDFEALASSPELVAA